MPPVDILASVISNVQLSPDYNVLTLEAPEVGALTEPGQFVMLKPGRGNDPLLRRPFSVFEVIRDDIGTVRAISVLNKRAGVTTDHALRPRGRRPRCPASGPLGTPFTPPTAGEAWMVAGGVGLAPFWTLAEALTVARDADDAVLRRAQRRGAVLPGVLRPPRRRGWCCRTEDGSVGVKGRVTVPLEASLADLARPGRVTVYACGPEPMLEAVAKLSARYGQPSEVSVERIMGCGLGGCYSCVVPVIAEGGKTRYVRSCIGGPVFDGAAIAWD